VLERKLDGLDSAFDPGAESARRSKEHALDHEAMVAAPVFGIRGTDPLGRRRAKRAMEMKKARGSGGSSPRASLTLLTAGLRPGTRAAVRIAQWGTR
jgi:hypothetical protein